MKVIRGNTERCLAHLAKAIEGRDFYEKRKMIAEFTDVGDATVHDWFSGSRMPVGEQLIRIRFYLEFLGYDVEELWSMERTVRDAARLYAFGVASLSEVADLVGYGGKEANDTLMRVFRGARNVSPERLRHFASFIELYGDRLEEKRRSTPKVLRMIDGSVNHQQNVNAEHAHVRPALRTVGESHSTIIEALANSMKAIVPLAEYVLSNGFTAEERDRVRKMAGNDVSRLSLLLAQLSGEAARNVLSNTSSKQ